MRIPSPCRATVVAALAVTAACATPPPSTSKTAEQAPVGSVATHGSAATTPPASIAKADRVKMINVTQGKVPTFAIDEHEVMVVDYMECMQAKVCTAPRRDSPSCNPASMERAGAGSGSEAARANENRARHPVNCVDVVQARTFCQWLNKRLPTEAEWDAAVVVDEGAMPLRGRLCGSSAEPITCEVPETKDPKSTDLSKLGLFDAAGNVAEWTSTLWVPSEPESPPKPPPPRVTAKGSSFTAMGGPTDPKKREPHGLRAAHPHVGFRCARGPSSNADDPALAAAIAADKSPPPPDVTEAQLVERYTALWKKLLAVRNQVSVDEIDRLVKPTRTELSSNGSFFILYALQIDWASVTASDHLSVRIEGNDVNFPEVPLDRWLESAEVERVRRNGDDLRRLPIGRHLKYPSQAAAVAALPGKTKAKFENSKITIEVTRPQWPTNDLYMSAIGVLNASSNECLDVTLNLVTGTTDRDPRPCRLH